MDIREINERQSFHDQSAVSYPHGSPLLKPSCNLRS